MSRSTHRSARGPLSPFTCVLVLAVTLLALLAPSAAWAVTPYSFHWTRTQANDSCESADLKNHDGDAYFRVNDTPLPTYQVPGALVTNADGSQSNVAEAGFDSVLLRVGENAFLFGAWNESGDNSCVQSREVVHLISLPLGIDKPLFDVYRDGTGFTGEVKLGLSLTEINPPLAQDIANLEVLLAARRVEIFANASKVNDLAAKLKRLDDLDAELTDLVTRPLDEIDQEDLDAILGKYADVVDAQTREALEQLVEDLQQSIADLHEELASLIDNFGAQADAAADLATLAAREGGFDPDDPSGYGLGAGAAPVVEIPDLSGVSGAFSSGNDPYDAYADAVIAALADDVENGEVVGRADFVAQVRGWRANSAALSKAIAMNGGSLAETNAFLNAQNKVTAYVQKFMDAQDWFKDSPMPADVRGYVGGVFKNKFGALADELKDALNGLPTADAIDLTQTPVFQTIIAFGGAMSAIDDAATPYFEMMATLVQATTRIAVGFVPVVGPTLDFCEAVTGKAWCLSDGKELSTEERIFAGAGVAAGGLGKFWGGVKNAGVGAKAATVAGVVAKVDEDIAKGLRLSPRTFKTLEGAMTSKAMDSFEIAAGKALQEEGHALLGIGDDGVRTVLDIKAESSPGTILGKAADFLSLNKGNKLVISEAKGGATVAIKGKSGAFDQLQNVANNLADRGLTGDVGWFEIIIEKGAKLETNYGVLDGYVVKTTQGNKPVEILMSGVKKFLKVRRI